MTLIARGVITRSFNTSPTSISFQPRSQETFMWSMPTRTLLGRVRVLWIAWRFSLELFIQQNFRSSFHAGLMTSVLCAPAETNLAGGAVAQHPGQHIALTRRFRWNALALGTP